MAAAGTAKVVGTALMTTAAAAAVALWAATWTGASTLLAIAIQCLVTASSLALLRSGMTRAERPADAAHPFGYASEITFWSFVVPVLLFAVGAGVTLHEGVTRLVEPPLLAPARDPLSGVAALGVALALALFAAWQAHGEFRRRRGPGPALVALRDVKDPALTSLLFQCIGGVAGVTIAIAGLAIAHASAARAVDAVTAILLGLLLAALAALMSIEVRALIAGEAAAPAVTQDVRAAIAAERGAGRVVSAINEIRTLQLGPKDVLVAASVDFEDQATAAAIEAATSRIETTVKARHPSVRRFFMEGQSARDHAKAEQGASAQPQSNQTAASSTVVTLTSSAPPTNTAPTSVKPTTLTTPTPASQSTGPAPVIAPPAPLPQRDSRKGRKRQKGKSR